MKKHLQFKIHGRVQGVLFRKSAQVLAHKLALVGWIENRLEGTVAGELEGEEKELERFLYWCRTGPPAASVFMVEFEFSDDLKNYQAFEIKR